MKVLIADKFPATHLRRLEESGHECAFHPDLGAGDLAPALGASEALVVRSTRVTEETLRAGERLELVIRAGAGTNTIDTEAASALGVSVCNVPGKNAVAVAELTLGLLIALDRRIADNVADLRAGRWDKKRYSEARGLIGARLGIVGLGAIGMAVAERACAFGLRVGVLAKRRAPDIEARLEALGVSGAPSIEALAAESDILTFHLPATPQIRGLLGEKLLRHVRPGTVILNTSRGDLVDETALLAALREGRIAGAGLDVFKNEPAFDKAFGELPNVVLTPHVAGNTVETTASTAHACVDNALAVESGRWPREVVANGVYSD